MAKNTENQTKFTTLINSIGYSGFNVTAIKQGLEYFLRKKDKKNFMLCLEELYLFSQFSENEKEEKIANGILSSIINKLILLFDEELSFIEIDKYFNNKLKALKYYKSQLHDFPHPRSLKAIQALAEYRGSTINVNKAEAFSVERLIE